MHELQQRTDTVGRRLQQQEGGWKPLRTVYLTYVPDEEIGGKDGINKVPLVVLWGGCEHGLLHDNNLSLCMIATMDDCYYA